MRINVCLIPLTLEFRTYNDVWHRSWLTARITAATAGSREKPGLGSCTHEITIPYLKNSDGCNSSQFVNTSIHPVMHASKGVYQTFSSDLPLLYEAPVEHVSSLHSLPVHLHAHPFHTQSPLPIHQCITVNTHTTTLYNPIDSLGVVLVTGIAREPAGCRTLSGH